MGELDKHIELIKSLNQDEMRRLMLRGEWPDRAVDAPDQRVDPSFYGVDYGNPFRPPDPSYYEYNRRSIDRRASYNPAYPSDFGAPVKLICNYCGTRNGSDLDRCKACGAPLVLEERRPAGVCRVESHEEIEDAPVDMPIPSLDDATKSLPDQLMGYAITMIAVILVLLALAALFQ